MYTCGLKSLTSDLDQSSMVIPCVMTNHLTQDTLEMMAALADNGELTQFQNLSSDLKSTASDVLNDVLDMAEEVEKRKLAGVSCDVMSCDIMSCDPSSFQDLKTKGSSSKPQVYNDVSDGDTSEPLDSELGACIQMRNEDSLFVDMVQTRDEEFRNKLQMNARRNQCQPQDPFQACTTPPLKEPVDSGTKPVQVLGKMKTVTVFENATTKSRFVQKQYMGKPKGREIEVLRAMKHCSIPIIYDVQVHGNSTILKMEYCGEPAATYIMENYFNNGSCVPESFIWNILEQMMDLLRFLALAKVVHRNITAESVCLLHTRKGLLMKVVGFGHVLTYQDIAPQTGMQNNITLGGTVQFCAAESLASRAITPSGRRFGHQEYSDASLSDDMIPKTGWRNSSRSDMISRPTSQTDMVACGNVALFMALGPAALNSVQDLYDGLGRCFPKECTGDLKDFILKMIDSNPQTGLKPEAGLDIIQVHQDVIEVTESDGVIELSDSDDGAIVPFPASQLLPASPQLQVPSAQGTVPDDVTTMISAGVAVPRLLPASTQLQTPSPEGTISDNAATVISAEIANSGPLPASLQHQVPSAQGTVPDDVATMISAGVAVPRLLPASTQLQTTSPQGTISDNVATVISAEIANSGPLPASLQLQVPSAQGTVLDNVVTVITTGVAAPRPLPASLQLQAVLAQSTAPDDVVTVISAGVATSGPLPASPHHQAPSVQGTVPNNVAPMISAEGIAAPPLIPASSQSTFPDNSITVNPGSSCNRELEIPVRESTQANPSTIYKVKAHLSSKYRMRDKPYIRVQREFKNFPNFDKIEEC